VAAGGGRLRILARQSIRRARSAGGDNLAAAWPVLSCYPVKEVRSMVMREELRFGAARCGCR
jgi:hypothetical protein